MEFVIYSRQGCHLCNVMKDELKAMELVKPGMLRMIDIDDDPMLKKSYHDQIPVLVVNDVEICRYKLNKIKLLKFLDSN